MRKGQSEGEKDGGIKRERERWRKKYKVKKRMEGSK